MRAELALPNLATLFGARSIALVGATEKSAWCQILIHGLRTNAYSGKVLLVNPRGGEIFDKAAYTSCKNIGEAVDLAIVMVPALAAEQALTDVGEAGIRFAVVLTSGFAELGADGTDLQTRLADRARVLGLTLLGPNCLGFVNYVDNVPAMVLPPQLPRLKGAVAVVSQSGATAGAISAFAYQQGVGLSYLVSTGNEAMIGTADVLDFLIEDPHTRAIALFAETIRDTGRFMDSAARALAALKPIVILKVGVSELTARVAQAHTGALVGDDKVFDAVCRQSALIRVGSIEELVTTASLLAYTGVIAKRGLGVVSISGGACELIADAAERSKVHLPRFDAETVQALRSALPEMGTSTHNPLDVTGAAVAKPDMFAQAVRIVGSDPGVGLTATVFGIPAVAARSSSLNVVGLTHIAEGIKTSGKPGICLTQTVQPINEISREIMNQTGVRFALGGIRDAVQAIGHAFTWSARAETSAYVPSPAISTSAVRPRGEQATLDYLSSCGVPVIPAVTALSERDAIEAARAIGGAVALKIASPDIAHKTEAGGVILNLYGDEAVAAGRLSILSNVSKKHPDALIEGVIVSPMRPRGTELFVGVARDPQWGLVLAVALGGVWVEAINDSSLRVLPVDAGMVLQMFKELRAAKILDGFRGMPALNLDAVAHVVVSIATAATALGTSLVSLEVNPLYVSPAGHIECLDALTVWR
jgi:acetate---CoA ligase (ADP-forming)